MAEAIGGRFRRKGPRVTTGIIRKGAYSKYHSNVEKREFSVGEKSVLRKCWGFANFNVLSTQ